MKITKKTIAVFVIFPVLVTIFVLSFFYSRQSTTKQNTTTQTSEVKKQIYIVDSLQTERKTAVDPLVITFSESPENYKCVVKNLNFPDGYTFSTTYAGNSLVISSEQPWPDADVLSFSVGCIGFESKISFSMKSGSALSSQEQFKVDSKNEVWIAHQREQFFKENPFVTSFPVIRDTYGILFIEKENVLLVSPKVGTFTELQKQQITEKERPLMKTLGVPDSIPLVFSLPQE